MERLLYGLALIGVTLACQAAPKPSASGGGSKTAAVALISVVDYQKEQVPLYMSYFPQTRIEPYSRSLGHFTNLSSANVDGKFAYTFAIQHSDCEKVSQWMNEIVSESQYFKKATTECHEPKTAAEGTVPQPQSEQPAVEAPAVPQPQSEQPAVEEPAVPQPQSGQPAVEEPSPTGPPPTAPPPPPVELKQ